MAIESQTVPRVELFGVLMALMDQGVPQYSVMFNWKNGTYTVSWPSQRKQVQQEDEE